MNKAFPKAAIAVLLLLALITALFALLFAFHKIDALGFGLGEASMATLAAIGISGILMNARNLGSPASGGIPSVNVRSPVSRYAELIGLTFLLAVTWLRHSQGLYLPRVAATFVLLLFIATTVRKLRK